jgi:murein DD-endopeptidase MepM/ murein hydrolase activator NlpD
MKPAWLLLLALVGAGATGSSGDSAAPRSAKGLDSRPFSLPLDPSPADTQPFCADFENRRQSFGPGGKYHAARDYSRPAGTPVYSMADGRVSFSGRMGGYGWLVIVDHPQANLYSLYGHLSPSRWRRRFGAVRRGELIAYLGDSTENGGTRRRPLVTHLHFGVRAGLRADYPGKGEWRWQAGWIRPLPSDAGWLHPAAVLAAGEIPPGGYPKPKMNFLAVWLPELLLAGGVLLVTLGAAAFALRKRKQALLMAWGAPLAGIGLVFTARGIATGVVLLIAGILLLGLGAAWLLRERRGRARRDDSGAR